MAKKKKQKPSTELIKQMQGKVAVYIDAANLEKSVQELELVPLADELRKSPYVDYYEDIYKLKSEFLRHSS